MESRGTPKGFVHSGLLATRLASAAILVNFLGVSALALAMFFSTSSVMFAGYWPDGSGFGNLVLAGMSYVFSPTIKLFLGTMLPLTARGQILPRRWGYSGYQPAPTKARRQLGASIFVVLGALTIPPIIIGGPMVLEPLVEMFGVLPFVPHIVGGALLIAAGILTFLWIPSPLSVSPPAYVSATGRTTFTARVQPEVREVILVICPFCGIKNPQGAMRCSNCQGKL